ncbi:Mur ligase domain-containing protein [Candidatus Saccharibacteria bacterium]|nr:Mur ligase domain-containing protein [Candidatus Saccharibacteria bacterium]
MLQWSMMNIFFSGINGTGIGPLALLANDAGFKVFGSDTTRGAVYDDLTARGIDFDIGAQDGAFLQQVYNEHGVDWFVYTSALTDDHPELVLARKLGIKTSKRDDLINLIIKEKGLKLVAIAGTHGKTTVTAMLIWAFKQLNLPLSYLVGTTLSFAPSGQLDQNGRYFVYECDEYDRNFLKFKPDLALITNVSFDHPNIYPTKADYDEAFDQFMHQSLAVIKSRSSALRGLNLPGKHNRINATLVIDALIKLGIETDQAKLVSILNDFPGASRRFEKLANNLYTDYAHHPEEVANTVAMARELSDKVAIIYQPHQNTRQHQVKDGYSRAFTGASRVFWLPTYLTREDPNLPVLTPQDLIANLADPSIAQPANLDEKLVQDIKQLLKDGYLVVLMSAGSADSWLRQNFNHDK